MPTTTELVMLKKADEFSSVFGFRKRFSSDMLVTHYRPNDNFGVRIGFIVAKKVAKLAVDRNYMRRVLRELCRQEQHVLTNVDIIIQVRKPFKHQKFFLIKKDLVSLFANIQKKLTIEPVSHA